jgi:hypothetical protein
MNIAYDFGIIDSLPFLDYLILKIISNFTEPVGRKCFPVHYGFFITRNMMTNKTLL